MNFVLVHGAWWNGWAWHKVTGPLEEAGHSVIAIGQLPSGGMQADRLGGLADDVAHVRKAVDEFEGDVVLVGHSYGGIVVTELADHPGVRHSVYISGFWPRRGQTLVDIRSESRVELLTARADGALQLVDDAEVIRDVLASDLDDALFADLYQRRLLQSGAAFVTPATAPVRKHPVTYLICDRDQGILPADQLKMADGADRVEHVDASHFAPLSRADEVAAVLLSV